MSADIILRTENIVKEYKSGKTGVFRALDDVSVGIERAKLTIIKGRSGSGKTTLLNMLSYLDKPTQGTVTMGDTVLGELSDEQMEDFRREHMGFVFQSVALFPIMSAYENVDFALRLAEYEGDRDARIKEVMTLVGIEERMMHTPDEMSGGEQQRVAIARAIAPRPDVLFADEPTGALDTATGIKVVKLFKKLIEAEGLSIVMTTHDPGLMQMGDTVYEMSDGRLV
ncbi:MAG: ABC transporter ATP-binding protein [Eubacterium sp.]|jgi:putative ABC transport system ATP-binding protein|nr:ABC transporter ATP-binding protein [Eubacterium sp.]